MIVDGKAIAEDIYRQLETRRAGETRPPRLGILIGGNDPVIESFVRIKARAAERLGVFIDRADLPATATTAEVIAAVLHLAEGADGIIVQLPLPSSIDVNAVLSCIPPDKDIDVINPRHSGERPVIEAPVARAVVEILSRSDVTPEGKRAVVVGAGRLVGKPVAAALAARGADVATITNEEGSLEDLAEADIVVLGAGDPAFVKPSMLKRGVALIDAGTSESAGKVVGDADPSCAQVASVFTPVPGGVGPVAVAMIFENLFDLADAKNS